MIYVYIYIHTYTYIYILSIIIINVLIMIIMIMIIITLLCSARRLQDEVAVKDGHMGHRGSSSLSKITKK